MGRNRNDRDNEGMKRQHNTDTSNCSYCANGIRCPYWFQDSDGIWYHDTSGIKGYVDNVVLGDKSGLPDLPDTPREGGKKGKDDDDKFPRRRFGLW